MTLFEGSPVRRVALLFIGLAAVLAGLVAGPLGPSRASAEIAEAPEVEVTKSFYGHQTNSQGAFAIWRVVVSNPNGFGVDFRLRETGDARFVDRGGVSHDDACDGTTICDGYLEDDGGPLVFEVLTPFDGLRCEPRPVTNTVNYGVADYYYGYPGFQSDQVVSGLIDEELEYVHLGSVTAEGEIPGQPWLCGATLILNKYTDNDGSFHEGALQDVDDAVPGSATMHVTCHDFDNSGEFGTGPIAFEGTYDVSSQQVVELPPEVFSGSYTQCKVTEQLPPLGPSVIGWRIYDAEVGPAIEGTGTTAGGFLVYGDRTIVYDFYNTPPQPPLVPPPGLVPPPPGVTTPVPQTPEPVVPTPQPTVPPATATPEPQPEPTEPAEAQATPIAPETGSGTLTGGTGSSGTALLLAALGIFALAGATGTVAAVRRR